MTCGYIYKIVFPNGKHYIGLSTRLLEQRTNEHKICAKGGDTRCLYNALRKYDMVDTFELIEIDTANTLEELCEKEIAYIIEYNSYYMNGNGYNMTHGGEGTNGYVFTEEDKQKMGKSQKKRFENPEELEKNSERGKKYWENPEARQEMSKIKKKYFEDHPEARQQLSEISKKQWETPEARQQLSEIQKKRYEENPEAREQMREIKKKYFEENPEAGKEHSEKMKKRFEENPNLGKEHGERVKKYYEDNPEAKRKLIDGKGKNKPFNIFTNDGAFVKTFTYQFEAKEYLRKEHNINSTIKIDEVLCGRRKSSSGFVFKYK
jgi:group I intron endonuclease